MIILTLKASFPSIEYDKIVDIPDKIPFEKIKGKDNKSEKGKYVSAIANEELVNNWLKSNLVTCFPSFRYELPYYLTDFFKSNYKFKKDNLFSGFLTNPIMVVAGIDGITNWLMDLVLDMKLYVEEGLKEESIVWKNVNDILSSMLSSKLNGLEVRFGLGRRNRGASRISVVKRYDAPDEIYPSIFGMSSGELAILGMFVELLRQADNLSTNIKIEDIQGIVLVDEIDKHLHIKLQKEVLPAMLELFPNVQFILSTHSPFLTLGLAENAKTKERAKIIDLDQGGVESDPQSIDIYNEVYGMMIGENNNFKQLYDELLVKLQDDSKPLVITEGKTDTKHIKNAIDRLGVQDLNVEFYEIGKQDWGDKELKKLLEQLAKLDNKRKIIGIFDRDNPSLVNFASDANNPYKALRSGSNVYVFRIPLVNEDEYGENISIEHYYHKKDLLKENDKGRRIFLGEEFYTCGNSHDGNHQTDKNGLNYKIQVNGVIDEKVFLSSDLKHEHSIAMSKNDFADLVCGNTDYAANFDFSNFIKIIDVIREICSIN